MMINNLVFYHARCKDGLGAAAAFYRNFNQNNVSEYIPRAYGQFKNILDELDNSYPDITTIYFLDVYPELQTVVDLCNANYQVVIIDHHKTSWDMFADSQYDHPNLWLILSKHHCGATLVDCLGESINIILDAERINILDGIGVKQGRHEYLVNTVIYKDIEQESSNELYELLGVRDLWLVNHPRKADADALATYLAFLEVDQFSPTLFESMIEEAGGLQHCIQSGHLLNEYSRRLNQRMIDSAYKGSAVTADGIEVDVIIGPAPSGLGSQFGEIGYSGKSKPTLVVAVFFEVEQDYISLGLRCNKNMDCEAVAKALGGGGHQCASGVTWRNNGTNTDYLKVINVIKSTIETINIKHLQGEV